MLHGVNDALQVPLHIFTACAKTTQLELSVSAYAPTALLHELMGIARSIMMSSGRGTDLLSEAIFLQLQHSGFLNQLPVLLSAVAAALTTAAGMTDTERQQVQGREWVPAKNKLPPRAIAEQLLDVVWWVVKLQHAQKGTGMGPAGLGAGSSSQQQPSGTTPVLSLPASMALMELVLALAHDVNRSLAQLGPTDCPDPDELATVEKAFGIVQLLCADSLVEVLTSDAARSQGPQEAAPGLQQVLLSPSLLPCLSLVIAFGMYTAAAEEQRQNVSDAAAARLTGGSSRGRGRSRSSKSKGVVWGSAPEIFAAGVGLAWQQANQALPSLPASHQKLCAALGLDVRMLPTLAAINRSALPQMQGPGVAVADGLSDVYSQLMFLWGNGSLYRLWEQKSAAQQQLELQLQLLLPGVLLDCATKIPTSSPGFDKHSRMAAQMGFFSAAARKFLTEPDKPLYGSSSRLQPQQQLLGSWVAEVLPATIKLARRVLPALQADADIANAADAAAAGSTTGGTAGAGAAAAASSSAAAGAVQLQAEADNPFPYSNASQRLQCLDLLLRFYAEVCDTAWPAGSLGPPAAASGTVSMHEHLNVSQEHAQVVRGDQVALLGSLFGVTDTASNGPAESQASGSFGQGNLLHRCLQISQTATAGPWSLAVPCICCGV